MLLEENWKKIKLKKLCEQQLPYQQKELNHSLSLNSIKWNNQNNNNIYHPIIPQYNCLINNDNVIQQANQKL